MSNTLNENELSDLSPIIDPLVDLLAALDQLLYAHYTNDKVGQAITGGLAFAMRQRFIHAFPGEGPDPLLTKMNEFDISRNRPTFEENLAKMTATITAEKAAKKDVN